MTAKLLKVALFAGLSLTLTVYIALQIAGVQLGRHRYELTATFDDVTNLQPSDPVRLAGVPVGQVTSVAAVDGRAVVRFAVDDTVTLAPDSEVAVRWLNLIGQRELVLVPGAASGRLIDGDDMTRTRSVVDLGALVNTLGPLTQAVDPAQVNTLVEALIATLDGNRASVASLVDDLREIVGAVADREATVGQLVDDVGTITDTVARRDDQVVAVIDNLVALTDAFHDSRGVLTDALDTLPRATSQLDQLLDANAGHLDNLLGDLATLTDTVHDNLGDFDLLLDEFPESLRAVFALTSYGDFARTNLVCVAQKAPPCPHPIIRAAPGLGAIDDPGSFIALLLGTG